MMMRMSGMAMMAMMLAACQPQAQGPENTAPAPSPAPAPPPALPAADACGAAKLAAYVGLGDSPARRAAIAAESGARTIRWLTPGMAVTMDYRPDRLNADIGADGRYTGFNCT